MALFQHVRHLFTEFFMQLQGRFMTRKVPALAVSIGVTISCILLISCGPKKASVYKKTKPMMDTLVSITVSAKGADEAEKAMDAAFAAVERFGGLVDYFSGTSQISEVNRMAGIRAVAVSPETLALVEAALEVSEKTGGAFDPTIGPVMRLWDFHAKKMPADEDIRRNLRLVNFRDVVVDRKGSTVFLKRKGMQIDLGGIAKGFAADLAVDLLRKEGITAGVVAAAGDIRTFGLRPDGMGWNVGIKNPRQKDASDEVIATIRLKDRAISTSGDYERWFEHEGKRYHHILDPRTGYPAVGSRSVSIISDRGAWSDAYSTALFVMGPGKGIALARSLAMDAFIIDSSGTATMTDGLQGQLRREAGH